MKPRSRPWRPKSWRTPKTPHRGGPLLVGHILKECWPQHDIMGGPVMERPWFAKLARERRWITWEQYFEYDLVDTGRRTKGLMFEDNPFFSLLKKADFAS